MFCVSKDVKSVVWNFWLSLKSRFCFVIKRTWIGDIKCIRIVVYLNVECILKHLCMIYFTCSVSERSDEINQCYDEYYPIHQSTLHDIKFLELLIQCGADTNVRTSTQETVFGQYLVFIVN